MDDDGVVVSIDDPSPVAEGDAGTATLTFTVSLDQADPVNDTTVDYTITGGNEAGSSSVVIPANSTSATIDVTTNGDTVVEADEPITVTLDATDNGTLSVTDAQGTSSFLDDDTATVTIADASGNEDDGPIQLSATLNNEVQGGFTVQVSTSNGTATTSDSDYTPINNLTLNFDGTAGEIETFILNPIADARIEVDETVNVSMSNLSTTLDVIILDTATITINNDDTCAATTSPVLNGFETEFCVNVLADFSQDLDAYVDTTPPADTELRWSTNVDTTVPEDHLVSGVVTGSLILAGQTTFYGFFYDDLNDCPSPSAVTVTLVVNEEPNAGNTNDAARCSDPNNGNTILDLDDRLTNADPGFWALTSSQPGSTISIDPSNIVNFDGQPSGDYIFTYTATASGACADQTVDLTVTIDDCAGPCNAGDAAPLLNGVSDTIEFCDGNGDGLINDDGNNGVDLNNYIISSPPTGTVLVWSTSNDYTITGAYLNVATVVEPGTYYAFYYDETNDCASPVIDITLTRNFVPSITLTTDGSRCGPGTVTLSASATVDDGSTITYNWYDASTGGNLLGIGANFITPAITTTTSFYVEARANGCPSDRVEVVATVNAAPSAGTPTNAVACNVVGNGGSNTIDLDGTLTGADPGTWAIVTDPSSGALTIGAGNVVDFVGLASGSYVFEYTTTSAVAPCTNTTVQVTISVSDCTVDSDNDGLTDDEENILGTSPTNPDTDGDGLTDGEEVLVIDDANTPAVPEAATDPLDPCDPFLTTDCNPEAIDLAITKEVQGTGPFLVGDQVVFVITVTNTDMVRVLDIVVQDLLATDFTYVSHLASLGTYEESTGEWTIPEMTASDASATLEITALITGTGALQNTATLTSSLPADNNAANNVATVNLNEDIDLAITKEVDDESALLNSEVTFTITVENLSLDNAFNIVVSDVLDGDIFEFISSNASSGTYDDQTGEWAIASLDGGAVATLEIRVRVIAVGQQQNTATLATSFPNDGDDTNNSGVANINVYASPCEDPGTICNIFTPNGDQKNDELKLVDHEFYPNNSFEVFDRYGNSVFQMDGYDSSWDGTGKNGQLPKGTYFYILDLDATDGSDSDVIKGWIQIIRD